MPLLCQNKHVPVINRISNIGILKISFLGPSTTAKGRPFVNPLARQDILKIADLQDCGCFELAVIGFNE